MKILFASDVYFSRSNGTTISAQRFVTRLRERGHEVRVLTNYDERPFPEPNMYALKTQKLPGFNHLLATNGFAFAKTDRTIIREAIEWADVVHMMMNFPMEKACTQICKELHKPMTTAFHVQMENITSQFNWGNVRWLNKALYRYFYRYFYSHHRFVHCPSQFMKDELIRYGYEGLDLRAISNGVSEKFIYRRPPEIGMFGTKFVILMVGRLSHEKRQDLIIEAIRRSRYSHQIQLVFAGNGPLKKQLEKQGEKLPVKPVFGYYTQEQLIEIMAQTDLYIHASNMESEAIGCIEPSAVRFRKYMTRHNLPIDYATTDGAHNWRNWRRYLIAFLTHYYPMEAPQDSIELRDLEERRLTLSFLLNQCLCSQIPLIMLYRTNEL